MMGKPYKVYAIADDAFTRNPGEKDVIRIHGTFLNNAKKAKKMKFVKIPKAYGHICDIPANILMEYAPITVTFTENKNGTDCGNCEISFKHIIFNDLGNITHHRSIEIA